MANIQINELKATTQTEVINLETDFSKDNTEIANIFNVLRGGGLATGSYWAETLNLFTKLNNKVNINSIYSESSARQLVCQTNVQNLFPIS